MANYGITQTTAFRPYSFEEQLKPLAMYQAEYDKQEAALSELSQNSSIWKNILTEAQEKKEGVDNGSEKSLGLFNQFYGNMQDASNTLATKGLDINTRKSVMNLKSQYASDIKPIEMAWTSREEARKVAMSRDPYGDKYAYSQKTFQNSSLDDWLFGNQPDVVAVDLDNTYKNAKAAAETISSRDVSFRIMSEQLNEDIHNFLIKETGYNAEEALDIILSLDEQNIQNGRGSAYGEFGKYISDIKKESRYDKLSSEGKKQFMGAIIGGINAGIKYDVNASHIPNGSSGSGSGGNGTNPISQIDRVRYYYPNDNLVVSNLNSDGTLDLVGIDATYFDDNGKFRKRVKEVGIPGGRGEVDAHILKRWQKRQENHDLIVNALKRTTNPATGQNYTEEEIYNMNRDQLADAIKEYAARGEGSALSNTMYRFNIPKSTFPTGRIPTSGSSEGSNELALQEYRFNAAEGKLSSTPDSKYSSVNIKNSSSIDVLYDPYLGTYYLYHSGKYYRLPEGVLGAQIIDAYELNTKTLKTTNQYLNGVTSEYERELSKNPDLTWEEFLNSKDADYRQKYQENVMKNAKADYILGTKIGEYLGGTWGTKNFNS